MIAIKAVNLGKTYKTYRKPIDSLLEVFLRRQRHEKFVAIAGINFELLQGETLGIIGDNGAGKSTLLKLLAGTIMPSEGSRECTGRLSAILELGSGFHPDFSGIENARMGCALLGLSPQEIEQALPNIQDFSELGDFFYKPVKTYSSGMYVRLAFSVVTMVDPDVLIVDEALSVGDQHFQKKSLDRMQAFRRAGKTIIFCSHNLYQVKELCNKAIWLEKGQMVQFGNAAEVVDSYQDAVRAEKAVPLEETTPIAVQQSENRLFEVNLSGMTDKGYFMTGGKLSIEVKVQLPSISAQEVQVGIVIMRNDGIHCYGVGTHQDNVCLLPDDTAADIFWVALTFTPLQLLSGHYYLCVYLLDKEGIHVYDHREQCSEFIVKSHSTEVGIAQLVHDWES